MAVKGRTMNVVKEEKKEWVKRGKLYTVGRAEIVETTHKCSRCHNNHQAILVLDCTFTIHTHFFDCPCV